MIDQKARREAIQTSRAAAPSSVLRPAPARRWAGRLMRVLLYALGLAFALTMIATGAHGATHSARMVSASDGNFPERVLQSPVPVLVDFWAPWCVPCRRLEGTLDAVAAELGDKVRIVRININWNRRYADRYEVTSLPTLLVFRHGQQVDRSTGVLDADEVKELLAPQFASAPSAAPAPATPAAAAGARSATSGPR